MKAIFGKLIYIGDETVLTNRYIVFKNQRILKITRSKPAHCNLIGRYAVITPAFIDAHSHIGASRAAEPESEDDINDEMDSLLFDLDVLDSIVMEDKSFNSSIESGVLYSCVLPGSGNVIGGKSVVIRNYASNTQEAFMGYSGLKAAFGYNPKSTTEWKGTRASTRMGAVSLLRKELKKAQKARNLLKGDKKCVDEIEPHIESALCLLDRSERLRIHVHKTDDILAALRLVKEFGLDITIEHASDVNQVKTFQLLAQSKIPVVYGPMDTFAYKVELKNENWRNIGHLIKSKAKFAIMTDHPVQLQRNLYLQLRFLRRLGLTKAQCISKITKEPAEILRMEKYIGTIEAGKFASFVCWKGDLFDLQNWPVLIYAEGKIIFEEK